MASRVSPEANSRTIARQNITLAGEKKTLAFPVPFSFSKRRKAKRVLGEEEASLACGENTPDNFRANGHGIEKSPAPT
jgi:hypothetical protein